MVFGAEKQVLRAGFDRDIDAAALGIAQDVERVLGALVRDVQPGSGPLREDHGARYCLDGANLRSGGEVSERIRTPGSFELRLAARHDGCILRMHGAAQAKARENLEALEHG